jgi:hypothetical protein
MLTLLVVPTFYDSIEITKDSMIAKFHARSERWNTVVAFLMTFVEAILALTFVRLVYRLLKKLFVLAGRRQAAAA